MSGVTRRGLLAAGVAATAATVVKPTLAQEAVPSVPDGALQQYIAEAVRNPTAMWSKDPGVIGPIDPRLILQDPARVSKELDVPISAGEEYFLRYGFEDLTKKFPWIAGGGPRPAYADQVFNYASKVVENGAFLDDWTIDADIKAQRLGVRLDDDAVAALRSIGDASLMRDYERVAPETSWIAVVVVVAIALYSPPAGYTPALGPDDGPIKPQPGSGPVGPDPMPPDSMLQILSEPLATFGQ